MFNLKQYVASLKEFVHKKYGESRVYRRTIKGKLKLRLLIAIILSYLISIIVLLVHLYWLLVSASRSTL